MGANTGVEKNRRGKERKGEEMRASGGRGEAFNTLLKHYPTLPSQIYIFKIYFRLLLACEPLIMKSHDMYG